MCASDSAYAGACACVSGGRVRDVERTYTRCEIQRLVDLEVYVSERAMRRCEAASHEITLRERICEVAAAAVVRWWWWRQRRRDDGGGGGGVWWWRWCCDRPSSPSLSPPVSLSTTVEA